MTDAWMRSATEGLEVVIVEFAQRVKTLAEKAQRMRHDQNLQLPEERVGDHGQRLLGRLFETMLQPAIRATAQMEIISPAWLKFSAVWPVQRRNT